MVMIVEFGGRFVVLAVGCNMGRRIFGRLLEMEEPSFECAIFVLLVLQPLWSNISSVGLILECPK